MREIHMDELETTILFSDEYGDNVEINLRTEPDGKHSATVIFFEDDEEMVMVFNKNHVRDLKKLVNFLETKEDD